MRPGPITWSKGCSTSLVRGLILPGMYGIAKSWGIIDASCRCRRRRLFHRNEFDQVFSQTWFRAGFLLSISEQAVNEEKVLKPALFIASRNACKVLSPPYLELSRTYASLWSDNSVQQVLLQSKSSDCTLLQFRLLVSRLAWSDNLSFTFNLLSSTLCVLMPGEIQDLTSFSIHTLTFVKHLDLMLISERMDCIGNKRI